jgi:hypothetical protein
MMIEVLGVFNISIGFTTILKFPENEFPKMNMQLKKGEQIYYVSSIAFNQPMSPEFSGKNNYSCILRSDGKIDLNKGDILQIL